MDEIELLQRTRECPLHVLRPADALPRTDVGRIVVGQLVRAGTSVGGNYGAAYRARSRRDFINKLGTFEQEADESTFRMEMVREGGLWPPSRVRGLHVEARMTRNMVAFRISTGRALCDTATQREFRRKSKIENQK